MILLRVGFGNLQLNCVDGFIDPKKAYQPGIRIQEIPIKYQSISPSDNLIQRERISSGRLPVMSSRSQKEKKINV